MASVQDLKELVLFEGLPDDFLEQLVRMVDEQSLGERQIIYEPGTEATTFYSLKRGKVLLESELAPNFIISVGAIKPGYSFGWSALFLPRASHTSYAVCSEPSDLFLFPGNKFLELLGREQETGYAVMKKVGQILENRLERRTAQFLKVIGKHPEIGTLLGM
jgi:CRP-like cAMP-binding protein